MSQQINLFNPVFLTRKKYFSAVAMLQALGLVVAGMIVLGVFANRQTASLDRLLESTLKRADEQRQQVVVLGKQFSDQGTSKNLEEELNRTEEQLRKSNDLLAQIRTSVGGNAEGFSRYLAALAHHSVPGVWLTGLEISSASNELIIKGRALSPEQVPAYVRSLKEEAPFAGRALSGLRVTAVEAQPSADGAAGRPGEPPRYLEFTLNIPLGDLAAPPPARGAG